MLGEVYPIYEEMSAQTHLLVAGSTGSGKSVVINGMMYNLLYNSPQATQFILLDPKRVELIDYKGLPHVIKYASEPADMVDALYTAMTICENRYEDMQARRIKMYDGAHLYVIIDEFADLMTTNRKKVLPLVQRLTQVGRAARIHVIIATQTPIAKILPTEIKCNVDSRIALRTRSAQDSRNILEETGCELLPRYGKAFFRTAEGTRKIDVPMYTEDDLREIVEYWQNLVQAA